MKLLILLWAALLLSSSPATAAWRRLPSAGLEYWIYTPAKAGPARSLVLNLHGCTQTAQDFKERGNWEATAEKHNLVVAIPDVPNGGVVLGCWDYYGADHRESNRHNGALIALTEKLLADRALGSDAVAHARMFFDRRDFDLATAQPPNFAVAPTPAMTEPLRTDYRLMAPMLFGPAPAFETVLAAVADLERQLNAPA